MHLPVEACCSRTIHRMHPIPSCSSYAPTVLVHGGGAVADGPLSFSRANMKVRHVVRLIELSVAKYIQPHSFAILCLGKMDLTHLRYFDEAASRQWP